MTPNDKLFIKIIVAYLCTIKFRIRFFDRTYPSSIKIKLFLSDTSKPFVISRKWNNPLM